MLLVTRLEATEATFESH